MNIAFFNPRWLPFIEASCSIGGTGSPFHSDELREIGMPFEQSKIPNPKSKIRGVRENGYL
jgi:hypothetical protein